jgi:acyl-CoA synthetase (AMP-forming)/AMP-acid ligase II
MTDAAMPALPPDARWRTMIDVFAAVADRGARPALSAPSADGDVVDLSGAALTDLIARAAGLLTAHGAAPGTTVGIHLDNTAALEALVLHWAVQWLGAAPVPLGTRLARPEVEYIVGHAGIVLVCSGLGHLALARAVAATTGVRILDVSPGLRALTAGRAPTAPGSVDEDDLADVLYTSGTTGRPKGVELTHANDVAVALEFEQAMGLTGDDVFQSAIPYSTSTGVHTNPLPCLAAGAHLVIEPAFDQHRVFDVSAAFRATTYLAAPSMLHLVLRDVDVSRRPSSLRHLLFGGSVMNAVTLERLAHAFDGCALTNLYGQTEAGPGGTVCKPEHILAKPGSIGNQGMGRWTEFAVWRDDGSRAAADELGEIVLRSPTVMRGYRGDPAQTAEALAGGWLHTGDLGVVDADGFLFYADRKKDLVIRGGMNVATAEVESVLMSFPGVADVAVIGVEHEVLGEDVLAVVVAPEPIEVDALLSHARTMLADYKTPRRVVFVDELPRNSMGKVLKRELRASL